MSHERKGSEIFEPELHWKYNCADGAMGKRGAVYEPTGGDIDAIEQRRLEAAARERPILHALGALSADHQRALRLAHEDATPMFRVRFQPFGELLRVTLMIVDRENAIDLLDRLADRKKSGEAKAAIEWITKRSRAVVAEAVAAFRAVFKAGRSEARMRRQAKRDAFAALLGR